MADTADQAYKAEEAEIEDAIAEALEPPAGCEAGPDWVGGEPHCRRCGTVIPEARLKAVPCTGLCVNCAAAAQESDGGVGDSAAGG